MSEIRSPATLPERARVDRMLRIVLPIAVLALGILVWDLVVRL